VWFLRVWREERRDYLAAHESGRVRVTIARAADFYGPRVLTTSDRSTREIHASSATWSAGP
jgi:hypothetical protein